jgi:predicted N-acetyltransferase YhbS
MMNALLRIAEPRDADEIVSLVNSAFRGEASRAGWTTEADLVEGRYTSRREVDEVLGEDQNRMIVAVEGTSLIGCVLVCGGPDRDAYFFDLAVAPALQSKGLGSALLAEAEHVAVTQLSSQRALMWVLSLRDDLISWCLRRGYHATKARVPFSDRRGRAKLPNLEYCQVAKSLAEVPRGRTWN